MSITCPVPNCTISGFPRQAKVNQHLRTDHKIPLANGHGGNMTALREQQQQNFSDWLSANGHPHNVSLFDGTRLPGDFAEKLDAGVSGEGERVEPEGKEKGKAKETVVKKKKRAGKSKRRGGKVKKEKKERIPKTRAKTEEQMRMAVMLEAWYAKEEAKGDYHEIYQW